MIYHICHKSGNMTVGPEKNIQKLDKRILLVVYLGKRQSITEVFVLPTVVFGFITGDCGCKNKTFIL